MNKENKLKNALWNMKIFWHIVSTDFWAYRYQVVHKAALAFLPFFLFMAVIVFMVPYLGFPQKYGLMLFISGYLGSDAEGFAASTFGGFRGVGVTRYLLTVPVSSRVVFWALMCSYAMRMIFLTVLLFPVAIVFIPKLLLVAKEPSLIKFIPVLLISRLFDSAFGFWLSSLMRSMSDVSMLWARILSPLSFIACNGPPWKEVVAFFPVSGYLLLLNPFQYINEAGRASIFGQIGYVSYPLSIFILVIMTIVLMSSGRKRLQKRFDFL
jgi:hypothetical protein